MRELLCGGLSCTRAVLEGLLIIPCLPSSISHDRNSSSSVQRSANPRNTYNWDRNQVSFFLTCGFKRLLKTEIRSIIFLKMSSLVTESDTIFVSRDPR